MDERAPETRRRARLTTPSLAFVGAILGIAVVVIAILIVVYIVAGLGAEGAEGP